MTSEPTPTRAGFEGMRPEDRRRIESLEEALGHRFTAPPTALAALTHPSFRQGKFRDVPDNQRLEFLGDAVLDLALSHRLYARWAQQPEGRLTALYSLLASERSFAEVARTIGLGPLLQLGLPLQQIHGENSDSVLADALEAVFGAVFLEAGLPQVMVLVDRHFAAALDSVEARASGFNAKGLLKERAESRREPLPFYRHTAPATPGGPFEVEVLLGETVAGRGSGRNKKEAEQAAAREALDRLGP